MVDDNTRAAHTISWRKAEVLARAQSRLLRANFVRPGKGEWLCEIARFANGKLTSRNEGVTLYGTEREINAQGDAVETKGDVLQVNAQDTTHREVVVLLSSADEGSLNALFLVLRRAAEVTPPPQDQYATWLEYLAFVTLRVLDEETYRRVLHDRNPVNLLDARLFELELADPVVACMGVAQLLGRQFDRQAIFEIYQAVQTDVLEDWARQVYDRIQMLRGRSRALPHVPLNGAQLGEVRSFVREQFDSGKFVAATFRKSDASLDILIQEFVRKTGANAVKLRQEDIEGPIGNSSIWFNELPATVAKVLSVIPSLVDLSKDRQAASGVGAKPAPKVFISHASEDKEAFVLPLALELKARGVDVWLDQFEIMPGDSISEKIDEGIRACERAVVVISPDFLRKGKWVNQELRALLNRQLDEDRNIVVPILWYVDFPAFASQYPLLRDNRALDAKADGMKATVDQLVNLFSFHAEPTV